MKLLMKTFKTYTKILPKLINYKNFKFLFFSLIIIRFFYLISLNEAQIVTYIPDDSFYYLQLAKNYTTNGIWTFDGIEPTTGFHKFYAFFIGGFFNLFSINDFKSIFILLTFFNCVLICISYLLVWNSSESIKPNSSWFVTLPFFSLPIIRASTFIMETVFIIFAYSLILYLISKFFKSKLNIFKFKTILIIISILGPWIRSDFGLYIFILLFISLFYIKVKNNLITIDFVKVLCISFIITCASTVLLFFHNYLISAELLQSSAKIKSYWSTLAGNSFEPPISRVVDLLLPIRPFFSNSIYFASIFIIFLSITICELKIMRGIIKNKHTYLSEKSFFLFAFGIITILGYLFVYSKNCAALQTWYSATFLIPVCCVFLFLWDSIRNNALLKFFVISSYLISIYISFEPIWKHQSDMYKVVSNNLKNFSGRIASWNAGIYGYFSGGKITNLDGLVNDGVIPFILDDQLMEYIDNQKISYIVDFELMINADDKFSRGGLKLDDLQRFEKLSTFKSTWRNSNLIIWKINPKR
jgi:hypothetical protein